MRCPEIVGDAGLQNMGIHVLLLCFYKARSDWGCKCALKRVFLQKQLDFTKNTPG